MPSEFPTSASLSEALGVTLTLEVADTPVHPSRLSAGEAKRMRTLLTEERREGWRRGRTALKRVLERLGRPSDTAALSFPHPHLSLTHAGPLAVAVAAEDDRPELLGVGVDLERDRMPRPTAARFFLSASERTFVCAQPEGERPSHLLRLWTVKEALFKADPDNADAALYEYELEDPSRLEGRAKKRLGKSHFSYVTSGGAHGTLSVAVCLREAA
jgi:4'-phosphopantetheinyl transferase EntD